MRKLEALLVRCVMGLAVAGAVGSAGCSDDGGLRGDGPRALIPLAESERLMHDSGMVTRERLVIRDQASWKTTWAELAPQGSMLRLPKVDFDDYVVIVATMGEQPYANYQIKVDEVNVELGVGYIVVSERSPGANCPTLPATIRPAAVVLLDRFDGEASFGSRTTVQPC